MLYNILHDLKDDWREEGEEVNGDDNVHFIVDEKNILTGELLRAAVQLNLLTWHFEQEDENN